MPNISMLFIDYRRWEGAEGRYLGTILAVCRGPYPGHYRLELCKQGKCFTALHIFTLIFVLGPHPAVLHNQSWLGLRTILGAGDQTWVKASTLPAEPSCPGPRVNTLFLSMLLTPLFGYLALAFLNTLIPCLPRAPPPFLKVTSEVNSLIKYYCLGGLGSSHVLGFSWVICQAYRSVFMEIFLNCEMFNSVDV